MKLIVLILAVTFTFAHAEEKIGEAKGTTQVDAAVAKDKDLGADAEFGSEDTEVSSKEGYRGRLPKGHSWRNTQIILKGMKKIRCRKGGKDPKTVAILALGSEGFCNQMAEAKNPADYPMGTVWVYHNGEHGNTVVKLKEGSYFSNRLMSAPPPSRGTLAAIMVPGCGKKERKCERAGKLVRNLKKLEKASDAAKSKRAEEGEERAENEKISDEGLREKTAKAASSNDDPAEFQAASMFPSPERLKAEELCQAHNEAFRSPVAFVECMDDKLK